MLTITYAPGDAEVAARLQQDLQGAFAEGEARNIMILLVSPASNQDKGVQKALGRALDEGLRVLPVLLRQAPLPDLINHLQPVDFTTGYDLDAVTARIVWLSGTNAGLVLKVRTPGVIAANRRAMYVMLALVVVMFVVALYLIAVVGIQAPSDEFAADHQTETAQVQDIIERYLPRSTQDALDFESTLTAVPSRLSPLLRDSATATAAPRP